MRGTFTIRKQRAAPERPTFPVNPPLFRVPEPCLAAILDCRMIQGILRVLQETFLNNSLLEKDNLKLSSKIQRIWHPLRGLRPEFAEHTMIPEMEMRRKPQSSTVPVPLFQSGGGFPHHTSGTCSLAGMMDFSRFPISEMHRGKNSQSMGFQSWKNQLQD